MSISIPLLNILWEEEIHFYSYVCWSGILVALAHALIALALLNSIKKLHRLPFGLRNGRIIKSNTFLCRCSALLSVNYIQRVGIVVMQYLSSKKPMYRGGISFNTGGSFSTSWMWKMCPGKLPCPRTWNNINFF